MAIDIPDRDLIQAPEAQGHPHRDGWTVGEPPPIGPARRWTIEPSTKALRRPLEPGEGLELINESGRPSLVIVVSGEGSPTIAAVQAAEAERDEVQAALDATIRDRNDLDRACMRLKAERGEAWRERDQLRAERDRLRNGLEILVDLLDAPDRVVDDQVEVALAHCRLMLGRDPNGPTRARADEQQDEIDRMRAAIELAHEAIGRQTAVRPDAILARVARDLGEFVRTPDEEGE